MQSNKIVNTMKTMKKNAFTLVEIMIVVAIIGLLAAIAIPNFIRSRVTSQMNGCINNLRLIDAAKQQWALEKTGQNTSVPADSDLQPYLGRTSGGELPYCPADPSQSFDTSYSVQMVSIKPTCQIISSTHSLP
jgi:prepilin-type N-terminal cleavage/methylation domain-containing protein